MNLDQYIGQFQPVTLTELDQLALMNRTDTKYILHERRLAEILNQVKESYRVLEISGCRMMPYKSVYFDTPDYFLYHCHHNGVRSRYKVRLRDYLISDMSFFEIKKKTNKNKTRKKRLAVPFKTSGFSDESSSFLMQHAPLDSQVLQVVLSNAFTRITLAGFETHERVTIDTDMVYTSDDQHLSFSGLVIIEVKRGGHSSYSPFAKALNEMRIFPTGFSKYCMGIVSMKTGVKYNNFKPKIANLKKIIQ